MPLQFTATNGRVLNALFAWIMRATTSLPTPVSPTINTFARDLEAASISRWSSATTALAPRRSGSFARRGAEAVTEVELLTVPRFQSLVAIPSYENHFTRADFLDGANLLPDAGSGNLRATTGPAAQESLSERRFRKHDFWTVSEI